MPNDEWRAHVATLSTEQFFDLIRLHGELRRLRLAEIYRRTLGRAPPG